MILSILAFVNLESNDFFDCERLMHHAVDAEIVIANLNLHQRRYFLSFSHRQLQWQNISLFHPLPLTQRDLQRGARKNLGGLILRTISFDSGRVIQTGDEEKYQAERMHQLIFLDENTSPNDRSRTDPDRFDHYEELDYPQQCHRPKWAYEVRPTCHHFHEVVQLSREPSPHQSWDIKYLSRGHYRQTWLIKSHLAKTNSQQSRQDIVLKSLRYAERRNFTAFDMHQVQVEAMTMLKTSSANRIVDIYGHCGTSVLVAAGTPIDHIVVPFQGLLDQRLLKMLPVNDAYPMNILTPEEKLYLSLAIAEGIAELHGFQEGVIVNDDVQLSQFLVVQRDDGRYRLKLNDFNNARVLKWNSDGPGKYCPFASHFAWVNRAPEELHGSGTDEMADVFAAGLVFYAVVTGLLPFYEYPTWDDAVQAIMKGRKPLIDPRYRTRNMIESRLVEIMELCWSYKPHDRVNIFQVVQHLRKTVIMHKAQTNETFDESELLKNIVNGMNTKQWNQPYERFRRYTTSILKDRQQGAY